MRKRRVIIVNDDPRTRYALELFFRARNYETMIFRQPTLCPVYGNSEECPGPYRCGDLVIMNQNTATMNGIDLLVAQQKRGCKLAASNKAIIAGSLSDKGRATLAALGSALIQTPLDLRELEKWVAECESRMDLGRPVAIRRREERQASRNERLVVVLSESIERVTVVNTSICGICFRTSCSLVTNQVITLRADSSGTTEVGLVRWVKRAGDGTFLVGLSFCI